MKKNKIFISYSHLDKFYLDELKRHLNPIADKIGYWDDTRIKAGQEWEIEISRAIDNAQIALMLVSADFFNSQFITNKELPRLLNKANNEGSIILFAYLKPCLLEDYPDLEKYQSVFDLKYPIASLSEIEREAIWVSLAKRIKEIIKENENINIENGIIGPKKLEEIMKTYLHKDRLQYLAYLSKDNVLFDCSCLNLLKEEIEDIFHETIIERTNLYKSFACEFTKKILSFSKEFDSFENNIEQGNLIRFVYDVSQGAALFGQVLHGVRDNIVGITIFQDNVNDCVKDFGDLIDEIRAKRNLQPIVKPNPK